MKKRAIQVKLVKDTGTEEVTTEEIEKIFDDKTAAVTTAVKEVVRDATKYIAVAVCGFVVLDTARQVLIAKASTPDVKF